MKMRQSGLPKKVIGTVALMNFTQAALSFGLGCTPARVDGGFAVPLTAAVSRAEAAEDAAPVETSVAVLSAGDSVVSGGTQQTIGELKGTGVQRIKDGAVGIVSKQLAGRQVISSGGNGQVNVLSGGTQEIWQGGTGSAAQISGGRQEISAGGIGMAGTVAKGVQYVNGGAGSATVLRGIGAAIGSQYIMNGGSGWVGTISGGSQNVGSGTATVEVMDGGTQSVKEKGNATVKLLKNGRQDVYGEATAEVITGGTQYVSVGGSGKVGKLSGGIQVVDYGGAAAIGTMQGGMQEVKKSAKAEVTLMQGGVQVISSGGSGLVGTLTGGRQEVQAGAAGKIIEFNGGTQLVAGGVAEVENFRGGTQEIQSGSVRVENFYDGLQKLSAGADVSITNLRGVLQQAEEGTGLKVKNVLQGGILRGGTQSEGVQTVAGGRTEQVTLRDEALQVVQDGGIADRTRLESGTQLVNSGGSAQGTIVSEGGSLLVSAGGSVTGAELSGGVVAVYKDGYAQLENMVNGRQEVAGKALVTKMTGGTQTVTDGGSGTVSGLQDGTQLVKSGGTALIEQMQGGTQKVEGVAMAEVTTLQGGVQVISSGGSGLVGTLAGGRQEVQAGAAGKIIELSGGTQLVAGGTAEVENFRSGTQEVQGGSVRVENFYDGLQKISAGARAVVHNLYGGTQQAAEGALLQTENVAPGAVLRGGTQNDGVQVVAGGRTEQVTFQAAAQQQVKSGGVTEQTVLDGGTQVVGSGGLAHGTIILQPGSQQLIQSGGSAEGTKLYGGTQTVSSGGSAQGTVVRAGGSLFVSAGGIAAGTELCGGEISVDDDADLQLKAATGGSLKLLWTGAARARFGDSNSLQDNFSLTALSARGDTVVLGHGAKEQYSKENTLEIGTMKGWADFVINSDLLNGKSDLIKVTEAQTYEGAAPAADSPASTVQVNYDSGAGGVVSNAAGVTFAQVTNNTMNFTAKEGDIGGVTYLPEIDTADGGHTWRLFALRPIGDSRLIKDAVGNRVYMLGRWRDADSDNLRRIEEIRGGAEAGIWFKLSRGKQRCSDAAYRVDGTFTNFNLGYDKVLGSKWTAGGAVTHSEGSEAYGGGSGESRITALTAYGVWQNKKSFVEIAARAGGLKSDFLSNGNSGLSKSGDIKSRGQGISVGYGCRIDGGRGWSVTPKAGFGWAHLSGAGYNTEDGTRTYAKGAESVMMNIGLNITRRVKKGSFYLEALLMHDFSGDASVTMTKGRSNTLGDSLQANWLDIAVGWNYSIGKAGNFYAEAGRSFGGGQVQRNWQYRIGYSIGF